jgi:hypothetical protein
MDTTKAIPRPLFTSQASAASQLGYTPLAALLIRWTSKSVLFALNSYFRPRTISVYIGRCLLSIRAGSGTLQTHFKFLNQRHGTKLEERIEAFRLFWSRDLARSHDDRGCICRYTLGLRSIFAGL